MKPKAYIISGSLFGDEGKGSFVDYLAHEKRILQNVRYNGGAQAAHTVSVSKNKSFTFSQLGSTMFNSGCRTYLSENVVVSPFNLIEEAKRFSLLINDDYLNIIKRIYINEKAKIVTPYHAFINQLREAKDIINRRGSVGTGVSEIINILEETGICIYASDLLDNEYLRKLDELYEYAKDYYEKNIEFISQNDRKHLIGLENINYLKSCYKNMLQAIKFNIVSKDMEVLNSADVILEGSQGLLIDRNYGIKPNTTLLDTTNHFGIEFATRNGFEPLKIGIIKAYISRHGIGALPTYDENLSNTIFDNNQPSNYWTGRDPIYGYFDAVLLRYSQKINQNDEYYISCLDQIKDFKELKICNAYLYQGSIEEDFEETFDYSFENNQVIIKDIISNSLNLKKYLNKCIPIYIEASSDTYIEMIEKLSNIKITLTSFGPTKEDKERRWLL